MSNLLQLQRAHGFALAKSLGYHGEKAADFLRDSAGVKSLLELSLGAWQALNKRLRDQVDAASKPHLVSEPQWGVVTMLKRKLKLDDAHFTHLVTHITGLEHERFLDVTSCRALIAGLNRIAEGKDAPRRRKRARA